MFDPSNWFGRYLATVTETLVVFPSVHAMWIVESPIRFKVVLGAIEK